MDATSTSFNRGRDRDSDSSSSRESTPRRQKRSFSPASDDDTEMPPMADDDTPSPPNKPLIRKPVAFSPPTNVTSTYEATTPPASSTSKYLPGQDPVKAPGKKRPVKRTKRSDEYMNQISRFRVEAYNPTPAAPTSIVPGSGPYASEFRSPPPTASTDTATTAVISTTGHARQSDAPNPSSSTFVHGTASQTASSTKKLPRRTTKARTNTNDSRGRMPTESDISMSSSQDNSSSTTRSYGAMHNPPVQSRLGRPSNSSGSYYRRNYDSSVSHYRRDYESKDFIHFNVESYDAQEGRGAYRDSRHGHPTTVSDGQSASGTHIQSTSGHHGQPGIESYPIHDSSVNYGPPGSGSHGQPSYGSQESSSSSRLPDDRNREIKRIVTLLIVDMRSGVEDHQLAEVKVALRPADDPKDGYWADAKALSANLQAGPSRIDGPAKVFTLRGKYRQFFLRVSANNEDEFISANLRIDPLRTLDVIVETPPSLGHLPAPPKVPRHLRDSPTPEPEYEGSPRESRGRMDVDYYSDPDARQHPRKRRVSPSFDDYDHDERRRRPTSSASSPTFSGHSSLSLATKVPHGMSMNIGSSRDVHHQARHVSDLLPVHLRGYESPVSDEEPEKLHELVSKAVDNLINKDPEWTHFFRAGGSLPQVDAYLKQYAFVQRMFNTYVGQLAPFKSQNCIIEKSHITEALRIEDGERFAADCTETLKLVSYYGKKGSRYEDPKVVEMMNDQSVPGYNEKPIKRFIRLLREIDERWTREHSQNVEAESVRRSPRIVRRGSTDHTMAG